MDAFTSLELEAQRRREVVEIDRRAAQNSRVETPVDGGPLARVVSRPPRPLPRLGPVADCQPAVATR